MANWTDREANEPHEGETANWSYVFDLLAELVRGAWKDRKRVEVPEVPRVVKPKKNGQESELGLVEEM